MRTSVGSVISPRADAILGTTHAPPPSWGGIAAIAAINAVLTAIVYVNLFRGGLFKARSGRAWDLQHRMSRANSFIIAPFVVFMWVLIAWGVIQQFQSLAPGRVEGARPARCDPGTSPQSSGLA